MQYLAPQTFGLALVNEDDSTAIVKQFSAQFHCVIQSMNDRMLALEFARRVRPVVVIVDSNLLMKHLPDFIARIRARWPEIDIVVVREGVPVQKPLTEPACEICRELILV